MKLLLIDNDSDTLLELRAICDELGYDVSTVHCRQLYKFKPDEFDLIVLSGGFWYDEELQHLETYSEELELIRTTTTPLLGICLGMQLMHVAFSGHVPLLEDAQTGNRDIRLTPEGQELFTLPEHITVHKNHTRGIITALPHFRILGLSNGNLEIMLHETSPLLGVQFHPEIGDGISNVILMKKLLSTIMTGR